MFGDLRRLGRETVVYGLSTVVARLLNFVLLPLYTHTMAPQDFGVVAAVFSYIALGNVLFGHGMDFAFMRHAAEDEEGKAFSTAFWSLAATALPLALIIHVAAGPLAAAAALPPSALDVVRYAAWIMALDALALVPFADLRLSHRAGLYAAVKVFNIVLNLALNYVFLVVMRLGVEGVFMATLLSSSATLAALGPVLAERLTLAWDKGLHRSLIRFALPLVPAGMASMVVQVIDRPILFRMLGSDAAGLYQANYRLGIFMMMVVNMFDAAWRPFFLQRAGSPDSPRLFARVLTYFCAGAAWVLLAVTFFVPDLVGLKLAGRELINPRYWGALGIVPVVTLGYLLDGVYVNFLAPVTLAKRTGLVAWATGTGAAVKLAATFALIPVWGLMGAAQASLLAYASMAGVLYWAGRDLYPVPYEWRRLAHLTAVCAAAFAVHRWLPLAGAARVLRDAALLGVFPLALVLTGFLDADERQGLKERLKPSR